METPGVHSKFSYMGMVDNWKRLGLHLGGVWEGGLAKVQWRRRSYGKIQDFQSQSRTETSVSFRVYSRTSTITLAISAS